jgi:hypothetical protein
LSFATTTASLQISFENAARSYPSIVISGLSISDLYLYGVLLLNPEQLLDFGLDFSSIDIMQLLNLTSYLMLRLDLDDLGPLGAILGPLLNALGLPTTGLYRVPLSALAGIMMPGGCRFR